MKKIALLIMVLTLLLSACVEPLQIKAESKTSAALVIQRTIINVKAVKKL